MPSSNSSKYTRVDVVETPPVILPKRLASASPDRNSKVKNGSLITPLPVSAMDSTPNVPVSSTARLYVNPSGSYTLRMQLSQGFLSAALLVSSVSQLRNHIFLKTHAFYQHVFWLIVGSICGQVAAALCLLFSYWARSKLEPIQTLRKRRPRCCVSCADGLENIYMIMTFFIMAVNVFIALFVGGGGADEAAVFPVTAAAQRQSEVFDNFTSITPSLFGNDTGLTELTATTEWNTNAS
ncbi:uncharacterized protein LOC129580595 [Paramacrobiotus metropolitanus]|uniref:uncharacterized protein LOC129580595 n=1 Tax=Paramacrobiotus metropolitanus TaxID=2943436 RepID=UPI00244590DA|nr:uncharacterized protein LOC129580595 [Paramacrobiotus metropolitanus]